MFHLTGKLPSMAVALLPIALMSGCGGSSGGNGDGMPIQMDPMSPPSDRAPAHYRLAALNAPTDGTQSSNSGDVARVNVLVDDQGNPEQYVVVLTDSNGNEQWRINTADEPDTLISNEERTSPTDNN